MGRPIPHTGSDPTRHFPLGIIPHGYSVLDFKLKGLFKLSQVRMNVFTNDVLAGGTITGFRMLNPRGGVDPLGVGVAQTSLNDDGRLLLDDIGHLVQRHLLVVDIVVAAVDVVAHNSGVGSLQGWGCDGHGRGLLLLLSWTAFHLEIVTYLRYGVNNVDEKKVVVKVGFEALNIDDNIAAANEITENTINEGEDEEDLESVEEFRRF